MAPKTKITQDTDLGALAQKEGWKPDTTGFADQVRAASLKAAIVHDRRGGARRGAGRKKTGRNPVKRKSVTGTITLPPEVWGKIDQKRGATSRGKFLRPYIERAIR